MTKKFYDVFKRSNEVWKDVTKLEKTLLEIKRIKEEIVGQRRGRAGTSHQERS